MKLIKQVKRIRVKSHHSLRFVPMFAMWDKPAIRISHFAGAAFSRKCRISVVATQRVSPFQPFKSVVLSGSETVLALHGVWTR